MTTSPMQGLVLDGSVVFVLLIIKFKTYGTWVLYCIRDGRLCHGTTCIFTSQMHDEPSHGPICINNVIFK